MPPERLIIMALAAAGYGSPEVLMNERADLVMDAFEFMTFRQRQEQLAYQRAENGNGNR